MKILLTMHDGIYILDDVKKVTSSVNGVQITHKDGLMELTKTLIDEKNNVYKVTDDVTRELAGELFIEEGTLKYDLDTALVAIEQTYYSEAITSTVQGDYTRIDLQLLTATMDESLSEHGLRIAWELNVGDTVA